MVIEAYSAPFTLISKDHVEHFFEWRGAEIKTCHLDIYIQEQVFQENVCGGFDKVISQQCINNQQ